MPFMCTIVMRFAWTFICIVNCLFTTLHYFSDFFVCCNFCTSYVKYTYGLLIEFVTVFENLNKSFQFFRFTFILGHPSKRHAPLPLYSKLHPFLNSTSCCLFLKYLDTIWVQNMVHVEFVKFAPCVVITIDISIWTTTVEFYWTTGFSTMGCSSISQQVLNLIGISLFPKRSR